MFLAIFNLIKFVISATNMLSYNVWGDTNFFTNIIKINITIKIKSYFLQHLFK